MRTTTPRNVSYQESKRRAFDGGPGRLSARDAGDHGLEDGPDVEPGLGADRRASSRLSPMMRSIWSRRLGHGLGKDDLVDDRDEDEIVLTAR